MKSESIDQLRPMIQDLARPEGAGKGAPKKPFSEMLKHSLDEVNQLQLEADQKIDQLMVGETGNIHETMIALEKADISFQLMMKIRGKILSAYQEIMRMPV